MEDHAEHPAGHSKVRKQNIVRSQGIGFRDGGADFCKAVLVCKEVEQGEEDGEWLLHAQEAVERPLAVELHNGYLVGDALCRDYVLAGVIALGRAVPEQEAVEEGWALKLEEMRIGIGGLLRMVVLGQFSCLQTSTQR